LFDGGDSGLYLSPPVLPERAHPLCLCELAKCGGVRSPEQRLADLLRHDEQLEDPGTPAIAGVATRRATTTPLEHETPDRPLGEQRRRSGVGCVARAALGANLPDEPLGQHGLDR